MRIKKVIIGSDHAGFRLKQALKDYLLKKGVAVKDVGTFSKESCDYPWFAKEVAEGVSKGIFKRGILICKTGIGNSIVANRFKGVRAGLCYNLTATRLSREHNDTNLLVLGAEFISESLAKRMVNLWLNTPFLGGRHRRRLNQIKIIEDYVFEKFKKD